MPKQAGRLALAVEALAAELKRFNDAHEPQVISVRKEAELFSAHYGESEETRETAEFLEGLSEAAKLPKKRRQPDGTGA